MSSNAPDTWQPQDEGDRAERRALHDQVEAALARLREIEHDLEQIAIDLEDGEPLKSPTSHDC